MQTILITGGCGAIGSEVINRLKLCMHNIRFINLDKLTYAGKKENIEPPYDNYMFVRGDICDENIVNYVLEKYNPIYVIHFAAETHVDNSFGNSFQFTKTNVYGTHVLLECVRQYIQQGHEFKMFIHMSTDEVYGSVNENEPARLESGVFSPSNPYAATKAAAEMICMSYEKSFGVPIVITRCNNAISKYQHPEKLIPTVISSLLSGKKIPIHGKGKSKRTFIHGYDIADAMAIILDKGELGRVYNIGTDMEYTVVEVVGIIMSKLGLSSKDIDKYVDYVPDRIFQDYRYCIDTSELRKLGWKDNVSFDCAIEEVIENMKRLSKD